MIIPIGHDQSAVRRLPWVTGSILAACVLAFLMTDLDAAHEAPARDLYFEQAADYFREHAYLDGHQEILDHVRYDVPPNQRSQYLPALRELTGLGAPETPEGIAAEQAELDRLTDLALGLSAMPEADRASPFRAWGLVPEAMTPVTLVSYAFLHAGWLHLLGNLLLLFVMGPALEDRWGRPLYGGFYLAAAVFSAVFYASLATDPSMPLVGASGAISGVMGAFLVRHWKAELRFGYFFFAGRVLRGTFEAPAWAMLPLWFANELLSAWWADASGLGSPVAYWAHVGGFLFGGAAAGVIRATRIEERFVHDKIESSITVRDGNSAVDDALAAREAGDLEQACRLLREEVERSPDDVDAVLAYWDAAGCVARPEEAAPAVARLVRQLAAGGDLELARQQWMELVNLAPTTLVDPPTLLKLLPGLRDDGDDERAALALRHAVDPANPGLTAGMAMRVIDEVGDADPPTTLRAARVALSNPDLHEAKRAKLEALVSGLEGDGIEEAPDVASAEAERCAPVWDEDGAIELDDHDLEIDPEIEAAFFTDRNATDDEAMLRARDDEATGGSLALDRDAERGVEPPPPVPPATPPPLPVAPPALPTTPPPVPTDEGVAVAALVDAPRFPDLKLVDGVPTRLTDDALYLQTPNARKAKIEFAKVEAIAVAAVSGLGRDEPVLLFDLLLNWNDWAEGPLRAVRLRSDEFDARDLVEGHDRASDALRALGGTLVERCRAVALPDPAAIAGRPFAVYASLASYEREVLQVGR